MNIVDWWQKVDDNWIDLLKCIEKFHPCYNSDIPFEVRQHQILVESACEVVRREIRAKNHNEEIIEGKNIDSPVIRAANAKINRDISLLSIILSETWFGAPESRSVYSVAGFNVLCDLLDDPPDNLEYNED